MRGLLVRGPEDGYPIVFLHGAMANLAMWLPEMELLADEFRCIAVDLPGHGERCDRTFTLESSVEMVQQLIEDQAGGEAILVGISLGGYVAIATAASHSGLVSGLVLSGAAVEFRGMTGWVNRVQGMLLPLIGPLLQNTAQQRLRKIAPPGTANAVTDRGHSFAGAGQALRDLAGRDFHSLLVSYQGPVLMLMGERDSHNVAAMPAMAAGVADVETQIIEDAGHSCSMSQPGAFSAAVAQLARQVGEGSPRQ